MSTDWTYGLCIFKVLKHRFCDKFYLIQIQEQSCNQKAPVLNHKTHFQKTLHLIVTSVHLKCWYVSPNPKIKIQNFLESPRHQFRWEISDQLYEAQLELINNTSEFFNPDFSVLYTKTKSLHENLFEEWKENGVTMVGLAAKEPNLVSERTLETRSEPQFSTVTFAEEQVSYCFIS